MNRVPAGAKQAQRVLVGAVLRPRGLKGELKVQILTNKLDIFSAVKTVFIDNKKYTVLRGSVQNGYAYLMLYGVSAVETAEKFRSKEIYINADDIELQEDEVLSTILIGFSVLNENGDKIGIVKNIENFGGGDFFEIAVDGAGTVNLPNEDEFIIETNMTNKTITVRNVALQCETIL